MYNKRLRLCTCTTESLLFSSPKLLLLRIPNFIKQKINFFQSFRPKSLLLSLTLFSSSSELISQQVLQMLPLEYTLNLALSYHLPCYNFQKTLITPLPKILRGIWSGVNLSITYKGPMRSTLLPL